MGYRACFPLLFAALLLFYGARNPSLAQVGELIPSGSIVSEDGPFGLPAAFFRGHIFNRGEKAYEAIQVSVRVYDENDALLSEGLGYPTRACGAAFVDFALLPNSLVEFVAPLELESIAAMARHEIEVSARPLLQSPTDANSAFQRVGRGEVVILEWLSATLLRFAKGCATAPFTALDWYEFDPIEAESRPIEHPLDEKIDESFRRASGIDRYTQSGQRDRALYDDSFLRGHHETTRFVYQNDLGHLLTAEHDGSYPRLVDESAFRNSLQGVNWLGKGRFLVHYYGAYGDPVRYTTATVSGQRLGSPIETSLPSQTRPGASADGLLLALGLPDADPPGYYLKAANRDGLTLLYATGLPGNHAPAPILYRDGEESLAFFVIPAEAGAHWQLVCLNRNTSDAKVLSDLPIFLARTERAWLSLAPDGRRLALAADGGKGGLWLLEWASDPPC